MALKPETQEQIKLFQWIKLHPKIKKYSFYIPNDGKRSKIMGNIMKRMGLLPGVSDVFIAYPSGIYHGLFIEIKAKDSVTGEYRKPTPAQNEFIANMNLMGYKALVCNGSDDAIVVIEKYL
jgi:hypothetical protein